MENSPKDIKIDITPDVAKGTYSNLVLVTHSATEIVFDFAQMLPGTPNSLVRDRIIMTPLHAKRFLNALTENIQKYEANFGKIVEIQPKVMLDPENPEDRDGNVPFSMDPMGDA